ncbi:MAG: Ni/Fe hydrogenase subunit alpha [Candidatus Aenigmatarchaeota archaeon]|nr:Ni/Fe hydrogenase subunit alpha [Candidatus Aenigmarchaeota archaeon]
MHKELDISLDKISKIEGSASLEIKIRKNQVKKVKLKITENKRFYTQAIRGKNCLAVHQIVSRICGTCSVAHLLCCIEAVEKALNIKPSEQTMLLRKLALYGTMIRDHALHLYFFVLPDILGIDSILEIDDTKILEQAFRVKAAGNSLASLIGGRAIHPSYIQVGYFEKVPDNREEIKKVINNLKSVRKDVLNLIEIFDKCTFDYTRQKIFVALITKDYTFIEGEIKSSDGSIIKEEDYWDYLNRVVIPYSQATGFQFKGREYMVGALARMNLNKDAIHKDTKKEVAKYLSRFPSNNVFHNNLAQAIEILHSIDHSIELLETSEFKKEEKPEIKIKSNDGVGVLEAPRGTLYYMLSINDEGKINYGNIVIPTAQNQIIMERDIKDMVSKMIDKSKHEIIHEIEKLIRAYDPCMSCASHFLRVKWDSD